MRRAVLGGEFRDPAFDLCLLLLQRLDKLRIQDLAGRGYSVRRLDQARYLPQASIRLGKLDASPEAKKAA